MAVKSKKKKPKKAAVEMTLWDVILSYPDLHDPKPYKGKIYFKTDALLDADHAQLSELKKKIFQVKKELWGDDKSEWPEATQNAGNKPLVHDGNKREDQKGYADRFYISPSTQTPVPVVDTKGKPFNPQLVKGGMFANVAIRISPWEYDGDEGVSIYLQGVQIDTSKASLNFGGGKSVKQMFDKDGDDEDQENDEDDGDDEPRGKKIKKPTRHSDDEEEDGPRKKTKKKSSKRDEEE